MKSTLFFLFFLCCNHIWGQIDISGPTMMVMGANSVSDENYLFLDFDNDRLFFSRVKHPSNTGGISDPADIWYVSLSDTTSAQRLAINDDGFSAPAGMLDDYLIYHQLNRPGRTPNPRILAVKVDEGSGKPLDLSIPFLKNQSPIQSGTLSADGRYLILSLENKSGFGVEDLYISSRESDGGWTSPRNLGATVNTPLQEITPYLAADNKTLFFASNGHGGQGSFDIFYAERLDDSWRNWSKPVNLGSVVNTSGAETSWVMHPDSKYAYFVSTQNSDGYGDIRKIQVVSEIEVIAASDTAAQIVISGPEMEKSISFKTINRRTKEAVTAKMLIINEGDTLVRTAANGNFDFDYSLPFQELEFKSEGFLSVRYNRTTLEWDTLMGSTLNVPLEPLESGNIITLDHVLFYRGTANFVEGSEDELDLVWEMLQENPEVNIFLKGHTDNVGNAQLNVYLSKERVEAVKAYLVDKGIAEDRISGEGYGGAEPIASNASEATRKLNRRVEFEVIREN